MEIDPQAWMNPDEYEAIAFINSLDNDSYILREVIFSETRFPVWEAAVIRYDSPRHLKSMCSYAKMLTDQEKLLTVAVKAPSEEVSLIAASKLEDKSELEKYYEVTDNQRERERIVALIDDDDEFVFDKLSSFSDEEVERAFGHIVDASVARRFCDRLPDSMTLPKTMARKRLCQLTAEKDLLEMLRSDDETDEMKEAVIAQLLQICKDADRENKKILFRPGDAAIIAGFACKDVDDEHNIAKQLLSFHRLCWKCGTKMELNGTGWGEHEHSWDFYNTKGRYADYKCPKCGTEIHVQVESWR